MSESSGSLKAQLRLMAGDDIALGPGKADLLQAIHDHGSITAAGKQLGMSYRRAWLLVDTMNRCFSAPLVESAVGGQGGGGAHLSELGLTVLAHYRRLQRDVEAVAAAYEKELQGYLKRYLKKS
jgi:molybdate transport system regulatory protein